MPARFCVLAVACVLGCVAAHVETSGPQPLTATEATELPAVVATALKSVADVCREVGGTPMTDTALERADLNGDVRDDYLLNVASVNCEGAVSIFSIYGDREKGVYVYVAGDAGSSTHPCPRCG